MATYVSLTSIFGNELKVYFQPRLIERQYTSFPGAHGLLSLFMGTRGRKLVITGRLRVEDDNYDDGREALQAIIDAIEEHCYTEHPDVVYTYKGAYYSNVVFDRFNLVPDGHGKVFHFSSEYVFADFVCIGRQLI